MWMARVLYAQEPIVQVVYDVLGRTTQEYVRIIYNLVTTMIY